MNTQADHSYPVSNKHASTDHRILQLACLTALTMAVGLFGSSPALAARANVVTSVSGSFDSEAGALSQSDTVAIGDRISTLGDSTASVMMGDSAVIRMCNRASMRFANQTDIGPSTLQLDRGEIKASAASRPSDNPFEIHTPAAIATLLGTAVHVSVNPESGETVVTALDHRIHVKSTDASLAGAIELMPGDQVVVAVGEKPGMVRQIDHFQFAGSSDCLDEDSYRNAALYDARKKYGQESMKEIVMTDMPEELPQVAGGPLIPAGTLSPKIGLPICLSSLQCLNTKALQIDPDPGPPIVTDPFPFP